MTRAWALLLVWAGLAPAPALAQYTTAIAVDAEFVYQGTAYGLWVRRRDNPAQIVARYVRNEALADAWTMMLKESDPLRKVVGKTPEGHRTVQEMLVLPEAGQDVLAQNLVQALAIDAQGRLWIASGDYGLVRRDGDGRFFHVPPPMNAPIQAMVARPDGLWVALSVGAARYEQGVWYGWEGGDQGLGRAPTSDVVVTPKGDLLFALYGGGVAWYEQGNFRQEVMRQEEEVARTHVHDWLSTALVDRRGILWAAVEYSDPDRGLLRREGERGILITKGLPADPEVTALAESPKLGLLVGTRHGLFRAAKNRVEPLPRGAGDGLWVNSLALDGDAVWVGTAEGLVKVTAKGRALFAQPVPQPFTPDDDVELQCRSVPQIDLAGDIIRIQRLKQVCRISVVEGLWGNRYPAQPWTFDCALFAALVQKFQPERWAEMDDRPASMQHGWSWIELLRRDQAGEWKHESGSNGVDFGRNAIQRDICGELERVARATAGSGQRLPP